MNLKNRITAYWSIKAVLSEIFGEITNETKITSLYVPDNLPELDTTDLDEFDLEMMLPDEE